MLIKARFKSTCSICGKPITKGSEIEYDPGPPKRASHPGCEPPADLFELQKAEQLADKLKFKRHEF